MTFRVPVEKTTLLCDIMRPVAVDIADGWRTDTDASPEK